MTETLRIATRESQLALWQANYIRDLLMASHPSIKVELVPMTTRGDQLLHAPLAKIGGKGLFIKELEKAMLDGRADLAAHSLKDVPMELPEGFCLAAVTERAEPRDALVAGSYRSLADIPHGSVIGSSSLRRQIQIRDRRPDLVFRDLRGNVNTRLAKLDKGEYDAIILASCGLQRLGMAERISARLDTEDCLPAAGQAVVGIECREGDQRVMDLLAAINHSPTQQIIEAERRLCLRLQASCQLPIAAYAEYLQPETDPDSSSRMRLSAFVSDLEGKNQLRVIKEDLIRNRLALADEVAEALFAKGAKEIIAGIV